MFDFLGENMITLLLYECCSGTEKYGFLYHLYCTMFCIKIQEIRNYFLGVLI